MAVIRPDHNPKTRRPGHPPPTRCSQFQLGGVCETESWSKLVMDLKRVESWFQFMCLNSPKVGSEYKGAGAVYGVRDEW